MKKIQETLYIGQWHLSPLQSKHLWTSHSFPNLHHLSSQIFLNLTDSLKSLLLQRWFYFWEKPEVTGCQIWAVGVWVTWVIRCFTRKPCVSHDAWVGALLWWSRQSSVAQSCSFLNHANSFHGGMFEVHIKFDADSLLYLLSHFECDDHTVRMLTQ